MDVVPARFCLVAWTASNLSRAGYDEGHAEQDRVRDREPVRAPIPSTGSE